MEAVCTRLRALVQDCLDKHLAVSAVFYADKLVTISGSAPSDVFLLAQVRAKFGMDLGDGIPPFLRGRRH